MTLEESQPQAFLDEVLALLEQRFPWLGKSDQEPVCGSDTVDQLSELHYELSQRLENGSIRSAAEEPVIRGLRHGAAVAGVGDICIR